MPPPDMVASDGPAAGRKEHGAPRALIWRVGDVLLAVSLTSIVEVAATDGQGRARSRLGDLALTPVPGIPASADLKQAVVVRFGRATMALAADDVEGVREYTVSESVTTPPWLRTLPTDHLAGLVKLAGGRVAALLAVDALHRP